MMCDFNLADALVGPSEADQTGPQNRCFDMTDVQHEIFKIEDGLDLVVSHNPVTMKCVANLVVAVNKMKKSLKRCGRELSNDDLCCALVDKLVDETIVTTTQNLSTKEKINQFRRVDSSNQCHLCDISQKHITHGSGGRKLQAMTTKGGHRDDKVNFKLSMYAGNCPSDGETVSVALSIINTNMHISCSMKDGRAVLNLEDCNKQDIQTISNGGDMDRFLFYKRTTGICLTTFESVRCRGWFISTCASENQPVEMCQADAARRVKEFKLN